MYRFEMELYAAGFARVAGVDEAGRGPLAGPVVAAAVILPRAGAPEGLRDSKLLTARRREALYRDLQACASIGVGLVSEQRIDEINIFQAARLAMKRAVEDLRERPDALQVDGLMKLALGLEERDVIDGDSLSASVAAASIVAKVRRDELFHCIRRRYEPAFGPIAGLGYENEHTHAFLSAYVARHGRLPPEARYTWGRR